jgi:hypothetical protein
MPIVGGLEQPGFGQISGLGASGARPGLTRTGRSPARRGFSPVGFLVGHVGDGYGTAERQVSARSRTTSCGCSAAVRKWRTANSRTATGSLKSIRSRASLVIWSSG